MNEYPFEEQLANQDHQVTQQYHCYLEFHEFWSSVLSLGSAKDV